MAENSFGWDNWTGTGVNDADSLAAEIDRIKKWQRAHTGIDFSAAGPDYPHPSQRVRTLYFFEGNGRLDPTGIQMIYGTDIDRGMFWVPAYTDQPTSALDSMSLFGYISGGVDRALIMRSIFESGTYALIGTHASSGNAYVQMNSAISNNTAFLTFKASVNAVENAYLSLESSTGVDGVVIEPSGLTADPLSAQDGQIFWRSDTNRYRVRLGGTYYNLALGDVPTTMNKQPYAAKTTTYTTTANDGVISVDASSASFTVTLVSAASNAGLTQTFKKINAANVVTIDASSTQTIDGALTYALSAQWSWVTVVSDGANWLITGAG